VTLLLPLHIPAYVYNTCCCLFCPCRQTTFASYSISSVQQAYQQALHALYMELLLTRRKAAAAHKQQQYHTSQHSLTQQQLEQLSPAAAAAAAGGGSGTAAAAAAAAVPLSAGEQALELQLVQLLLGLLQCELQAGHNEQAVAKIQVCNLLVVSYQPGSMHVNITHTKQFVLVTSSGCCAAQSPAVARISQAAARVLAAIQRCMNAGCS
jgi:hypothetical protein